LSNINKCNPLAKAVRAALFATTAVAIATPVYAEEATDDQDEHRVTVTGTRIKRAEAESATPMTVITAEDMANQGRLTVADALRNSTANSFGSLSEQSGSSAQSQATVSLLGAGSDRTLILLDGKRLPGSPSLGGTAVNLNQIPVAMIERIEIMKDGGSAVYGSDAVAGVINIITKKDLDGLTIAGGMGRPGKKGADSEQFSVVGGITGGKGSVTFAFEHQSVDAIFDKDRPYTASAQEDLNGDGVIQAYFETQGTSFYGATVYNPNTGLVQASPNCANLTANVPGFVGVLGGDAVFGPGGHTVCGYAYADISANKASIKRNSMFVNASYEVNSDVEFFSRMMLAHNRSFGRYAPPAAGFPFIPVGNINNPTNNDANPQDTFGWFRWYQLGPRDNNIDDYTQDYIGGFTGSFGETAEWEMYYHYNHADNKSVGSTYLSFTGLYTNLYLGEPFDSAAGLGALSATTLNEDRNIFSQWFAGVGFDSGELAGGAISHYFGAEVYSIQYNALVDKQSEAGWIGGSAGNSASRDRDVTAVFYEAFLPVIEDLEVHVAIRYDDYSDFGTELSPKVSVRYQASDNVMLRASWGQGFRAPTLQELSSADAFSAESAVDYFNCFNNLGVSAANCPSQQFNTTVQSNENLGAETSEFINLGVVWSATDDLTLRMDYADLTVNNAIGYVSVQDLIYMDMLGVASPSPDVRLIRNAGGSIDEAFTGSENGAGLNVVNLDLEADYALETSFGKFNFRGQYSTILEYNTDLFFGGPQQNLSGFGGAPKFRASLTSIWTMGDHSVAWQVDTIDKTAADVEPVVTASSLALTATGSIESLTTHNMSYTYDAGNYGRYTLGARNLLNQELPRTDGNALVYSSSLYTPAHLGRTLYFNVSVDL